MFTVGGGLVEEVAGVVKEPVLGRDPGLVSGKGASAARRREDCPALGNPMSCLQPVPGGLPRGLGARELFPLPTAGTS